jgi:hypothetical protein
MAAESRIELDGRSYSFDHVELSTRGEDWDLALTRRGAVSWLGGTWCPPRLRLDLRSLDALFEALLGAPITAYPGGYAVCEAYLEVSPPQEGLLHFHGAFEFDWDRALDVPGAVHPEPRTARFELWATR